MQLERNQAVADLIPHRGPMHLIDRILWLESSSIRGEVSAVLREAGPYFGEEGFEMHWLIELAAQASAALYRLARHAPGDPPSSGYLVSVRQFEMPSERRLRPGDEVRIKVEFEVESTPLGQSHCQITIEDEILGLGELTFLMEV